MIIRKTIAKNKKVSFLIALLVLTLFLEIFLRLKLGFCDAVLMQESAAFEYISQPNQDRYRFGKHVIYNSFSMRSEPVDTTSTIVLGFGDSVINGGTLTDQDSLATSLLSDSLSQNRSQKIQVLNVSAGSWGPDNCAAYLYEKGDFKAKYAFLVASSHDAFDNMDFKKIVGVDPNYPDQQYRLAVFELFDRYLIPRVKGYFEKPVEENLGINKDGVGFNKGFSALNNYFKGKGIPFFIYLHSEYSEQQGAHYNEQGELIIEFCRNNNIDLISDLTLMSRPHYRDNIHLTEIGQKRMFEILNNKLKKEINR